MRGREVSFRCLAIALDNGLRKHLSMILTEFFLPSNVHLVPTIETGRILLARATARTLDTGVLAIVESAFPRGDRFSSIFFKPAKLVSSGGKFATNSK
jgi:adenine/guanine phosphoribosyltransferase-like PRPP-binding protein